MILPLAIVAIGLSSFATATACDGSFLEVPLQRKSDFSAYLAEVSVRSPLQKQWLKVDTGSPTYSFVNPRNVWCMRPDEPCKAYGTFDNTTSDTSSYKGPGFYNMLIDGGSGDFMGDEVSIGGKSIPHGYFGYINTYPYESRVQNPPSSILGMSLTCDFYNNHSIANPWLLPQLRDSGAISRLAASFYLGPDDHNTTNSLMILGDTYDAAKISGKPFTMPMVDPCDATLSNGQTNVVNLTRLSTGIDGVKTGQDYGQKNDGRSVLLDVGSPFLGFFYRFNILSQIG